MTDCLLKLTINNSEQLRSYSTRLSANTSPLKTSQLCWKNQWWHCNTCYKKNKEEKGREVAQKPAKQTNTFCDKCTGQPQMFLLCFNALHQYRFLLVCEISKVLWKIECIMWSFRFFCFAFFRYFYKKNWENVCLNEKKTSFKKVHGIFLHIFWNQV